MSNYKTERSVKIVSAKSVVGNESDHWLEVIFAKDGAWFRPNQFSHKSNQVYICKDQVKVLLDELLKAYTDGTFKEEENEDV